MSEFLWGPLCFLDSEPGYLGGGEGYLGSVGGLRVSFVGAFLLAECPEPDGFWPCTPSPPLNTQSSRWKLRAAVSTYKLLQLCYASL